MGRTWFGAWVRLSSSSFSSISPLLYTEISSSFSSRSFRLPSSIDCVKVGLAYLFTVYTSTMTDAVEEGQEIDPEYVESHLQVTMGLIWDQITTALGNQAGLLSSGPKIDLQPRPPRFVSYFIVHWLGLRVFFWVQIRCRRGSVIGQHYDAGCFTTTRASSRQQKKAKREQ